MRAARSCAKATITEYGTAPFSADLTTSASSTGTWRAIWSRCAAHPGRQAITGRRYTRAGLGRRETSKCCRHLWRRPIATGLPSSTCLAYRNRHWVSIAINMRQRTSCIGRSYHVAIYLLNNYIRLKP
jgi:hypothetical protein